MAERIQPRRSATAYQRSDSGCLTCNGFPAIPEKEVLKVDDRSVAPYTLPLEALTYDPPPGEVICEFKNGDKERKLHTNIELNKNECAEIGKMQAQAREQKLEFYPSVSAMASRYLSRARNDPKKALQLMQNTQAWRTEYFKNGPVTDESVEEDMRYGIIYFCGRDNALRPTIVVRACRIPQKWYKEKSIDKLIRILIFCMEYMIRYMVVPGKVECNCLIVDLKGISTSQVPMTALKDIYNVMSQHYIGRVYTFYIVNLSSTLSFVATFAQKLLTDRQRQKIRIVEDMKQLKDAFALHQLEDDLGGARPVVREFFPFPLLPGPFSIGYSKGGDKSAIRDMWRCMTRAGSRGRLWNPRLSVGENTKIEYSSAALEIFENNELPLPSELQEKKQKIEEEARLAQAKLAAKAQSAAEDAEKAAAEGGDTFDATASDRKSTEEISAAISRVDSGMTRYDSQPAVTMEASTEDFEPDPDMLEGAAGAAENIDLLPDGPDEVRPAGIFSCWPCSCNA